MENLISQNLTHSASDKNFLNLKLELNLETQSWFMKITIGPTTGAWVRFLS